MCKILLRSLSAALFALLISGGMIPSHTGMGYPLATNETGVAPRLFGTTIEGPTDPSRRERGNRKMRMAQIGQDMDARFARARDLARLTVPADGPHACLLSDPGCADGSGGLNLLDGWWETTEESTTIVHESATIHLRGKTEAFDAPRDLLSPAEIRTEVRCLTRQDATDHGAEASCVKEKRRSGDRLTWKSTCIYEDRAVEEHGGITYNGSTYSGVTIRRTEMRQAHTTRITKLTGHRIGDGTCNNDRASAPEGQSNRSQPPNGGRGVLRGPVK